MKLSTRCSVTSCPKIPIVEIGPEKLRFCHEHQLSWERYVRPFGGKAPISVTNEMTNKGDSYKC